MTISRMLQPRQQYGLGSLVKSIGKGVKKFVKSPFGKAALVGLAGFGMPGTSFGGLFGRAGIGGKAMGMLGHEGIGATLGSFFGPQAIYSTSGTATGPSKFANLFKGKGKWGVGGGLAAFLLSQGMGEEEVSSLSQDPDKLRKFLRLYHSQTNPLKGDKEIDEWVEQNMASGGRVGFQGGGIFPSLDMGGSGQKNSILPRLGELGSGVSSAEQELQDLNQRLGSAQSTLGSSEGGDYKGLTPVPYRPGGGGGKLWDIFHNGGGPRPALDRPALDNSRVPFDHPLGMQSSPGDPISLTGAGGEQGYAGLGYGKPDELDVRGGGLNTLQGGSNPLQRALGAAHGGRIGYELGAGVGSAKTEYISRKSPTKEVDTINRIYEERGNKGLQAYLERNPDLNDKYVFNFKDNGELIIMPNKIHPDNLDKNRIMLDLNKEMETRMKNNAKGFYKSPSEFMSPEDMEKMKGQGEIREQQRKDMGLPNWMQLLSSGGRIGLYGGDKAQAAGIMGQLPVRQNKAGVSELDLRDTGGFIPPVGVKEKADDVPAMLSNNEFVWTADAVRAAGGGSVDKGAQILYDQMKKLENRVA